MAPWPLLLEFSPWVNLWSKVNRHATEPYILPTLFPAIPCYSLLFPVKGSRAQGLKAHCFDGAELRIVKYPDSFCARPCCIHGIALQACSACCPLDEQDLANNEIL